MLRGGCVQAPKWLKGRCRLQVGQWCISDFKYSSYWILVQIVVMNWVQKTGLSGVTVADICRTLFRLFKIGLWLLTFNSAHNINLQSVNTIPLTGNFVWQEKQFIDRHHWLNIFWQTKCWDGKKRSLSVVLLITLSPGVENILSAAALLLVKSNILHSSIRAFRSVCTCQFILSSLEHGKLAN